MAKEIPAVTFRVLMPITSPSCGSHTRTHRKWKLGSAGGEIIRVSCGRLLWTSCYCYFTSRADCLYEIMYVSLCFVTVQTSLENALKHLGIMGKDSFTRFLFITHCLNTLRELFYVFNRLVVCRAVPCITTRADCLPLLTRLTSGPPELPYCKTTHWKKKLQKSVFVAGFTEVWWYMCLHVDSRWWLRPSGCSPCLSCGGPAPCPPSGWC